MTARNVVAVTRLRIICAAYLESRNLASGLGILGECLCRRPAQAARLV